MSFIQAPPTLGNQYDDDAALRSLLARLLPAEVLREVQPSLREMGRLSAELYPAQLADRLSEPALTQWDAWGSRVDRIELTPLWRTAERIAAEHGVVATAYERAHGRFSRIHQLALAYLFTPSTDIYACPLAMTDGAARVLLDSGNRELIDRAVPRLTSRDPAAFWTSGQWMTETTGGSDVGRSETEARRDADGYITYVGRTDDVFKASDYRISPFELESVLIEHEAVVEAATARLKSAGLRITRPRLAILAALSKREQSVCWPGCWSTTASSARCGASNR